MDPEYLSILMCPKTRGPLRPASPAEVARANDVLEARGGDGIERVEEGLVCVSAGLFYPVRDGIPVLLTTQALPITPAEGELAAGEPSA
jgi:uncharacterized protein YbaR (Trm112 family)